MSSGGRLQETPAAFMKKCREMKRRFSAWKEEFIMEKSIKRYMPIFVLPTFFAFILGFIVPFIMGIWLSFCKFTTVTDAKFVGFSNYIEALKDTAFRHSFWYTVLFAIASLLIINIIAFALAMALTKEMHGTNVFRTVFFMPNLIGGIVLGYVWKFVFNRAFVSLGKSLSVGALSTSWLATTNGAMACLIIVSVWQYAGYMMLIYVAGFMSVSKSLMEAAQIDGCTKTQATINVTIPLMRSSFVQCLFLTITRCFMVYDVNLSLTKGEPFNSSVMAAMHVYNQAFTYKNYGTGQAEALILFVVCAIVGVTQVYIGKKGEVAA